jgi:glycosyltransferase involved in cell wall biosynthesis
VSDRIVAVVPAHDRADSIAATVLAVKRFVAEVIVVDDGSSDDTASRAEAAGATVLRLPHNRGKGGAVTAGVESAPDADIYLLVDADTGDSAAATAALLRRVVDGEVDMAIGVLPAPRRSGGFGVIKRLAAAGIRRYSGFEARAPLSGQRAVRGDLLRSVLPLAPRFGLETALTIDAVRAGARVGEFDVLMGHRPTGRSLAGFRHRARQGADIAGALWSRRRGHPR